jgi:hypothetical protein
MHVVLLREACHPDPPDPRVTIVSSFLLLTTCKHLSSIVNKRLPGLSLPSPSLSPTVIMSHSLRVSAQSSGTGTDPSILDSLTKGGPPAYDSIADPYQSQAAVIDVPGHGRGHHQVQAIIPPANQSQYNNGYTPVEFESAYTGPDPQQFYGT